MDNIGDYLIILFFALSFLSSLLKKKKKVEKPENVAKKPAERIIQSAKEPIGEERKEMNAFELFFNSLNETENKASKQVSEVDMFFENAFTTSEQKEDVRDSIKYNSVKENSDTLADSDIIEKQESQSSITYKELIKNNREKRESKRANEIKETFFQKDSIRKIIIMKEVLGKPKALQR